MRTVVLALLALGCEKTSETLMVPIPVPAPVDAPLAPTACDEIIVFLETGGTWIGAPPEVACFADNTPAGERDLEWVKQQFEILRARLSKCRPVLLGAAANGVTYGDLLNTMDAAHQVWSTPTDVGHPAELSMQFTMAKQRACIGALSQTATRPPRTTSADLDPSPIPMVEITATEIRFGTESVISVEQAMKESNKAPIPELTRAIPVGSKRVLVAATQRTDAKLINRVIKSVNAAGVERLAFTIPREPVRQPQRRN